MKVKSGLRCRVSSARLTAAGSLDAVWMPDERTRAMRRRVSRRAQLVRAEEAREPQPRAAFAAVSYTPRGYATVAFEYPHRV